MPNEKLTEKRIAPIRWNDSCTPGMGVSLWGASPLHENPWYALMRSMLPKVRAEGKWQGRFREEWPARKPDGKCASRRTETAPPAKRVPGAWSSGESARHNKTRGLRRQGQCGGCARKAHALIPLKGVLIKSPGRSAWHASGGKGERDHLWNPEAPLKQWGRERPTEVPLG